MEIIKGRTYQWRNTQLRVVAGTTEDMCVDPDSDFYREYIFEGFIVDSDRPAERGTKDTFAACGGWEEIANS